MRKAKEDDLATILEWHLEVGWLSDLPLNQIYYEVYGDGWIVAEQDGELVGKYLTCLSMETPLVGHEHSHTIFGHVCTHTHIHNSVILICEIVPYLSHYRVTSYLGIF